MGCQTSKGSIGPTPPQSISKKRIILMGPPASGKGTVCAKLKELGMVHVSTGDILRAEIEAGSNIGKKCQAIVARGDLIPDADITKIVETRLHEEDCERKGFCLDGFPRTKAQAKTLLEADISVDICIVIDVPDDVLLSRIVNRRLDPETGIIYNLATKLPPTEEVLLRCIQRADDTEEACGKRLALYHGNAAEISSTLKNAPTDVIGAYATVDGNVSIDTIVSNVVELLK